MEHFEIIQYNTLQNFIIFFYPNSFQILPNHKFVCCIVLRFENLRKLRMSIPACENFKAVILLVGKPILGTLLISKFREKYPDRINYANIFSMFQCLFFNKQRIHIVTTKQDNVVISVLPIIYYI